MSSGQGLGFFFNMKMDCVAGENVKIGENSVNTDGEDVKVLGCEHDVWRQNRGTGFKMMEFRSSASVQINELHYHCFSGYFVQKHGVDADVSRQTGLLCLLDNRKTPHKQYGVLVTMGRNRHQDRR